MKVSELRLAQELTEYRNGLRKLQQDLMKYASDVPGAKVEAKLVVVVSTHGDDAYSHTVDLAHYRLPVKDPKANVDWKNDAQAALVADAIVNAAFAYENMMTTLGVYPDEEDEF